MRSGMFTSVNGDRKYTSQFFAEYFASFIGNGVFPNPSTNTQVIADGGMSVIVQEGKAWIDGYILYVDNPQTLTLDTGDNLLPRIDKVVIRLDKINREVVLAVKKGTPATNPVAPSLQRDGDMHELGIANIYIDKLASTINQRDITDLRLNSDQCGIVKGTIEEIDTTTLFNQYQNWIAQKKAEYDADLINYTNAKQAEFENWVNGKEQDYDSYVSNKQGDYETWVDAKELDYNTFTNDKKGEWDNWYNLTTDQLYQEFNTWFQGIKDILDGDAVGNILNRIDEIPLILSGITEPENIRTGDYWFREVN